MIKVKAGEVKIEGSKHEIMSELTVLLISMKDMMSNNDWKTVEQAYKLFKDVKP